jgi:hypothetical protein
MTGFYRGCAAALLVIMAGCVLLAGCTTTPPTTGTPIPTTVGATGTPAPSIMVTSPANGATVSAGNVTVTAVVTNFNVVDKQGEAKVAGQGHVHFYMDVSPLPSNASAPAIPPGVPASNWAHVSGTTYTFSNVTPGQHTFAVQLANNDHTPVFPIVTDSVTVTVAGAAATTAASTTMMTTGTTASSTTVAAATTARSSGGSSGY